MKNNSLHEGTARKFAAILLCGLLSLDATAVAANATSPSLNQGQGDGSTVRVWWDTARYK